MEEKYKDKKPHIPFFRMHECKLILNVQNISATLTLTHLLTNWLTDNIIFNLNYQ